MIMRNGKELASYLARQQKGCEFSLRFLLEKQNTRFKNFSTMLKLVKKGTEKEAYYDYGDFILGKKLLDIQEGLNIIASLYPKEGEKGKLVIPNYDEFVVDGDGNLDFAPSRHRYDLLKNNYPMRSCSFRVQQDQICQNWNRELLKESFPYYPNLSDAVIDSFDLAVEHFSNYGYIYAVVVDYRAQIESLKLTFSKAEIKLNSPEIEYKDLVIKVFAKSGAKIATLPDIYPESDVARFDIGFEPDALSVVLLSRKDLIKIDAKEFTKWIGEDEGVVVERPEEEILSLTRTGESQNIEYKYDVNSDDPKNDFIETVIAFLNTNRGIILVGVDDDGNVVGSQKSLEDVQKLIHDSCEPPPRVVKTEEKWVSGKKVIIVEVPEGDDKPYQSKRDKNWYVRHNATDMKMERSELSHILEKSKERYRSYSS
jgi:hypothetical protein